MRTQEAGFVLGQNGGKFSRTPRTTETYAQHSHFLPGVARSTGQGINPLQIAIVVFFFFGFIGVKS